MNNIPLRLKKCPLLETVFEVRFVPQVQDEVVISEIYLLVKDKLGSYNDLPIMQLPAEIRKNDPNLRYVPYHQFQKEEDGFHFEVRVGPRTLCFQTLAPYPGWRRWSQFMKSIVTDPFKEATFWGTIERTGLRYINLFENESESILDKIVAEITLSKNKRNAKGKKLQLTLEETHENTISITRIATHKTANRSLPDGKIETKSGALIDIDCIQNLNIPAHDFFEQWEDILENAHNLERNLFFDLLTDSFRDSLEPVWEEEK